MQIMNQAFCRTFLLFVLLFQLPTLSFVESTQLRISSDLEAENKDVSVRLKFQAFRESRLINQEMETSSLVSTKFNELIERENLHLNIQKSIKKSHLREKINILQSHKKQLNKAIKLLRGKVQSLNKSIALKLEISNINIEISSLESMLSSNGNLKSINYSLLKKKLDEFDLKNDLLIELYNYDLKLNEINYKLSRSEHRKIVNFVDLKSNIDSNLNRKDLSVTLGIDLPFFSKTATTSQDLSSLRKGHGLAQKKTEHREKVLSTQIYIQNLLNDTQTNLKADILKLKKLSLNEISVDGYLDALKYEYKNKVHQIEKKEKLYLAILNLIKYQAKIELNGLYL